MPIIIGNPIKYFKYSFAIPHNCLYILIDFPIGEGCFMTLGQRLRHLRELAGLSQNELARRANIPQPVISDVERGKQKSMTLENGRRIARVLGVTLDFLAGSGDEDEQAESMAAATVG
jgi:ribosome-binding protein aMBF1 (putative translation factor)